MNNAVRNWFYIHQPLPYMYLVDYAKEIESRSYGTNRIVGDLPPHWGLEARLLSIQLFTHALDQSDRKDNNGPLSDQKGIS